MEQIRNRLQEREKYLSRLIGEKKTDLVNAPEGFLHVCSGGKKTQYYKKENSKDAAGTYIREKDKYIARELAQRDYDKQVLRSAEKELHAIRKYLSGYPALCPEQVYGNLHKERQKLVCPIRESDAEYIQKWDDVQYQGKGFNEKTAEFYTAKGERVRSKSEVMIADLLNREKIPYRYEYPIKLSGWGTVYPDFTVLHVKNRKEIIWEHLGRMDDAAYAEKALQKIAAYEQNGFFQGDRLILTYETQKNPLNQKRLLPLICHYLH